MADTNQDKVDVKKVVIQMGRRELTLDIDEAKELRGVLNSLFGEVVVERRVEEHHHHHDNYPWYWKYNQPFWSSQNSPLRYESKNDIVYCSTVGSAASGFSKELEVK